MGTCFMLNFVKINSKQVTIMSVDYQEKSTRSSLSHKELLGILLRTMLETEKNAEDGKMWSEILLNLSKTEFLSEPDSVSKKPDEKENDDALLYTKISQILTTLGVPANLLGYRYLRYAIFIVVQDVNSLYGITKILYPAIAKKYDSSASRVERAIRHAIEVSFSRGDFETIQSFFGNTININSGKPTNSEFIYKVADTLRMEYDLPFSNP